MHGWGSASPSCFPAALQSSEQLLPAVGVVEAWPGAFPGLQAAEGLGRGEWGHPSPCLADKPGLARRKEVCWALQGAASGAGTSALPGPCSPAAPGPVAPPVPAGPRPHGSTVSGLLLGHFPLSAGSLRLGGGCGSRDVPTPAGNLCPLNCTQLGQGPKLPDLLQADVGFGMILAQSLTQGTSWQWG